MDFNTAEELLALCNKENKNIAEIMRLREIIYGEYNADEVDAKMKKSLDIMRFTETQKLHLQKSLLVLSIWILAKCT